MRHDLVRKLSQHSVYEQVGRRKLGHEPIRHGRFIIIVDRGKIAFKKIRAGGSARYTLFQLFGMKCYDCSSFLVLVSIRIYLRNGLKSTILGCQAFLKMSPKGSNISTRNPVLFYTSK